MKSLAPALIKSAVFIAVTVVATTMLALTITDGSVSGGRTYYAVFGDVTSLQTGDDVRMAGVRIGQVESVAIHDRREAIVGFTLPSDRVLASTVTAAIRYRNLIGQRYIELDQGDGSLSDPLRNDATIPRSRTQDALDLTVLFNGFQPLFQVLNPKEVNELTAEIIAVFQGEGPTIDNLLSQTASLTSTLADKDAVIGKVIDNLNAVLHVVNSGGNQLATLITSLSSLVSGLAADRGNLGTTITGFADLSHDVTTLLQQGRAPLKTAIVRLGQVSEQLSGSAGALNSFLKTFPTSLTKLGRTASYGSWVNVYLCSVSGRIPVPAGYGNVKTKQYKAPAGVAAYPTIAVGSPNPSGLVGVRNGTARCT